MADEIKKVIDIDQLLAEKAPRLKKWLPNFIVNYLKKVIHQDDLNLFFHKYGHLDGQDFADAILYDFKITIKVEGEEKLPADSHLIFASNHPLGGMDGVAILDFLHKHYAEVKSPVNDLLMHVRQLNPFFIPVNKLGKQSKDSASQIYDCYGSDAAILFFPAGVCSRRVDFKGTITDLEWKKTFISKAVQYKRDVVPIHFVGQNSDFFYGLGYWRKKLGLPNIEMLYLVDELYKATGKTFTIKIGDAIPFETFDRKVKDYQSWTSYVRQKVYEL